MDIEKIFEVFLYAVPALITGMIAYYFFKEHTKNEDGRRRFLLRKDLQVNALPIRLQAYERMASYESLLIASIEQEFEHNLSQQIYLSDECWSIICAAKSATIQLIRKASLLEKTNSANKLREVILTEMMEKRAPSDAALSYVKNEVSELW